MKTTSILTFSPRESWKSVIEKLKKIFTQLSGYDIMLPQSRKDIT